MAKNTELLPVTVQKTTLERLNRYVETIEDKRSKTVDKAINEFLDKHFTHDLKSFI